MENKFFKDACTEHYMNIFVEGRVAGQEGVMILLTCSLTRNWT